MGPDIVPDGLGDEPRDRLSRPDAPSDLGRRDVQGPDGQEEDPMVPEHALVDGLPFGDRADPPPERLPDDPGRVLEARARAGS